MMMMIMMMMYDDDDHDHDDDDHDDYDDDHDLISFVITTLLLFSYSYTCGFSKIISFFFFKNNMYACWASTNCSFTFDTSLPLLFHEVINF